jgi:hypothetical protein
MIEYPIIAVIGQRGHGKSLLMTKFAKDYHLLGVTIFANYHLYDIPYTYITLEQVAQFPEELHDCILFLDEMQEGVDAYEIFAKRSSKLNKLFTQLRKRHIQLIWATQHWKQIAPRLKRQTNYAKILERKEEFPKGVAIVYTHKCDGGMIEWNPIKTELFDGRPYFNNYNTDEVIHAD